ncbi:MAG: hypothetical protein J6Y20_07310 [Lachnospiraceae bacterium]|nr:hypothetical protein [Lachnospiraceae bacterium]
MGIRNLTCVYCGGELKVAQYGQWDGGPSMNGLTCLRFLQEKMDEELFRERIMQAVFISNEDIAALRAESHKAYGYDRFLVDHPELSRSIRGDILERIQETALPMQLKNDINFARDSLFCEWVYVIDLDSRTFEVYRGFNETPLKPGDRFFDIDRNVPSDNEYRAVRIKAMWGFDELPDDDTFVNTLLREDAE